MTDSTTGFLYLIRTVSLRCIATLSCIAPATLIPPTLSASESLYAFTLGGMYTRTVTYIQNDAGHMFGAVVALNSCGRRTPRVEDLESYKTSGIHTTSIYSSTTRSLRAMSDNVPSAAQPPFANDVSTADLTISGAAGSEEVDHYIAGNRAYFDKDSHKYDDRPMALKLARKVGEYVATKYAFDEDATTLLDYACGTGKNCHYEWCAI